MLLAGRGGGPYLARLARGLALAARLAHPPDPTPPPGQYHNGRLGRHGRPPYIASDRYVEHNWLGQKEPPLGEYFLMLDSSLSFMRAPPLPLQTTSGAGLLSGLYPNAPHTSLSIVLCTSVMLSSSAAGTTLWPQQKLSLAWT